MTFAFLRALTPRGWLFVAVAVLILALWLIIVAWGNARYEAGATAADAKWQAAGAQLEARAAKSADRADRNEAGRIADQNERLAAEKEKIDEARARGSSPLDVLFPVGL